MQTQLTSQVKPIWDQFASVHLFLYFKNKDSEFAKQATEAFKALEKKHPKRVGSVSASNSRLIEEALLPMLMVQDRQSGDIVAQVLNFSEYFTSKQALTPENAEKLLKIKGILEPTLTAGKAFENKKDELEYELAVGSSYLQNQLNSEELQTLNKYITEKERIVELKLEAKTINYRDCLINSYISTEDPYDSEIASLTYSQNPADPSTVLRTITFKHDDIADGATLQN